jgi:hypothetical protein
MKARRNRRYYAKKKDARRAKAAELEQQVKEGTITEAQAATELSKFDMGWYKYRTAVNGLREQLTGLQERLAQATLEGNLEEVNRLNARIEEVSSRDAKLLQALTKQSNTLAVQYTNQESSLPSMPTGSSLEDFLRFLSLCLPVDKWNDEPMDKEGIRSVRLLLHPDKWNDPNNRLATSEMFKADTVLEWYQNFQESVERAKDFWDDAGDDEKDEFRREWKREQENVLQAVTPTGPMVEMLEVIRRALLVYNC